MLAKLRLISNFQKKCSQTRVEIATKLTEKRASAIDIIITLLTWHSVVQYAYAFIENFIVLKSLLWQYLSYFQLQTMEDFCTNFNRVWSVNVDIGSLAFTVHGSLVVERSLRDREVRVRFLFPAPRQT